jgi:hypothetical protein
MRGTTPPLCQYAFMAWCSIKKSAGRLYLTLPYLTVFGKKCTSFSGKHVIIQAVKFIPDWLLSHIRRQCVVPFLSSYFPHLILSLSLPPSLVPPPLPGPTLTVLIRHLYCMLHQCCKGFLLRFPSRLKVLYNSAYLFIAFRASFVFVCQTQQLTIKFGCFSLSVSTLLSLAKGMARFSNGVCCF